MAFAKGVTRMGRRWRFVAPPQSSRMPKGWLAWTKLPFAVIGILKVGFLWSWSFEAAYLEGQRGDGSRRWGSHIKASLPFPALHFLSQHQILVRIGIVQHACRGCGLVGGRVRARVRIGFDSPADERRELLPCSLSVISRLPFSAQRNSTMGALRGIHVQGRSCLSDLRCSLLVARCPLLAGASLCMLMTEGWD
ncbi:hypothetical protein J3458_022434 [Metarhizium acridum]|uniref:uncharacterized protein n=1 Tax=Metarhizium acridum TaxID=92637 RepID=UPI001C6CEF36|nr:hypothetical protein J3458_022434 [Metarhizium acridum]